MSTSNKYLSTKCPEANAFVVDKSHTDYYIKYYETKSYASKISNDWENIKVKVNILKGMVESLKECIDSQDLRAQSKDMLEALTNSIKAVDSNLTTLFTNIVSRYRASMESDEWFSNTAALYAEYIATTILGLHGADSIKPDMAAVAGMKSGAPQTSSGTETQSSTAPQTADELLKEILGEDASAVEKTEVIAPPTTAQAEEVSKKKAGLFGRIGATVGTFLSGVVEGIVNVGELAVDAVAVASTAAMTPFTLAADAVGAVGSAITGTEYKSATAELFKDCGTFVSKDYSTDWFDSYYDNTKLGQSLKNNSYAFDFARGSGKVVGEVAAVGGALGLAGSASAAVTILPPSAPAVVSTAVTPLITPGTGSALALGTAASAPAVVSSAAPLALPAATTAASTALAVGSTVEASGAVYEVISMSPLVLSLL